MFNDCALKAKDKKVISLDGENILKNGIENAV